MRVISQWSPCLYLDPRASLSHFSPLMQLGKGEWAAGWVCRGWSTTGSNRCKTQQLKSEIRKFRFSHVQRFSPVLVTLLTCSWPHTLMEFFLYPEIWHSCSPPCSTFPYRTVFPSCRAVFKSNPSSLATPKYSIHEHPLKYSSTIWN